MQMKAYIPVPRAGFTSKGLVNGQLCGLMSKSSYGQVIEVMAAKDPRKLVLGILMTPGDYTKLKKDLSHAKKSSPKRTSRKL